MIGSLAIMVLAMIFSFDSIYQTTWSTSLLQVNDPVRLLSCSTLEYYPSGISTILCHCTTPYEIFVDTILLLDFAIPWVLGCRQPRTPNTFFSLFFCWLSLLFDCILLKPLDIMCRGPHQLLDFFQVLIGLIMRNTIL